MVYLSVLELVSLNPCASLCNLFFFMLLFNFLANMSCSIEHNSVCLPIDGHMHAVVLIPVCTNVISSWVQMSLSGPAMAPTGISGLWSLTGSFFPSFSLRGSKQSILGKYEPRDLVHTSTLTPPLVFFHIVSSVHLL